MTSKFIREQKKKLENFVYQRELPLENVCDVGILFGGFSMLPHRANKAIELYQDGKIKRILCSGGIGYLNTDRKIPEAIKLQEYLLKKGISKTDILIEPNSRNTYENILLSLHILKEHYYLNGLRVSLITSDYHRKKCIETTHKQTENKMTIYGVGAKNGKNDKENWDQSILGICTILKECLLLNHYTQTERMERGETLLLEKKMSKKEK